MPGDGVVEKLHRGLRRAHELAGRVTNVDGLAELVFLVDDVAHEAPLDELGDEREARGDGRASLWRERSRQLDQGHGDARRLARPRPDEPAAGDVDVLTEARLAGGEAGDDRLGDRVRGVEARGAPLHQPRGVSVDERDAPGERPGLDPGDVRREREAHGVAVERCNRFGGDLDGPHGVARAASLRRETALHDRGREPLAAAEQKAFALGEQPVVHEAHRVVERDQVGDEPIADVDEGAHLGRDVGAPIEVACCLEACLPLEEAARGGEPRLESAGPAHLEPVVIDEARGKRHVDGRAIEGTVEVEGGRACELGEEARAADHDRRARDDRHRIEGREHHVLHDAAVGRRGRLTTAARGDEEQGGEQRASHAIA